MYNFSYKLTYNESSDDDVYRKELLDVFFLNEYNGDNYITPIVGIFLLVSSMYWRDSIK